METKTTVSKWGNSLGIRIPKQLVMKLNISEGDQLDITIKKVNQKPASLQEFLDLQGWNGVPEEDS
jgi:antitoxin component of MazEF toxin-antitoxin module